jgi:hypothetical protein
MEYRAWDPGGMLCSHDVRAAPLITYRERGSTFRVKRSHREPIFLLKRKGQAAPSDNPMITSNAFRAFRVGPFLLCWALAFG